MSFVCQALGSCRSKSCQETDGACVRLNPGGRIRIRARLQALGCCYAINAINDIIDCMASITIRKLPENTKRRLRMRAARNGRSMEQEARDLLETGLARADAEPENLGEAIRRRFAPLGGVDLKIPRRRGTIREIQFK